MAGLSDGMRIGGVYADVGLNFDQLDKDLSELNRRLDAAGRSARVSAGVSVSGGGGGGGILTLAAVVGGEIRRMAANVGKSLGGVTGLLQRSANALAQLASASKAQQAAAHDFYREQRRQEHVAKMQVGASRAFGGDASLIRPGGFQRLPADVLYSSGISPVGMRARFGGGGGGAVAPAQVAEIVREVAAAAGRTTAAGGYAMKPGRYTKAGSTLPPYDLATPGKPNVVRNSMLWGGRAGHADPLIIPALAIETIRQTAAAYRDLFRLINAGRHGVMLTFNMMQGGLRSLQRGAQRLSQDLWPLTTIGKLGFQAMILPIRLASGAMGLFGRRTEEASLSMAGLGRSTTTSMSAAGAATAGLASSLSRAVGFAKLLIVGFALRAGFNAMREYAKSDKTTEALGGKVLENLSRSSAAIGKALQPTFQQVLALIVDIQNASSGITPIFAKVFSYVGNAVASVAQFARMIIASWSDVQEFIGATFLQMAENAPATFKYFYDVAATVLGYLRDNWRAVFSDIFEFVKVGITNSLQNIKDFVVAAIKYVQSMGREPFGFKFTPLMDGAKFTAPKIELPEFKLPNSYAQQMGDALNRIRDTKLATPEDLAKGVSTATPDKGRSRVGEMLGARELMSMFQQSASEKGKDSKNLEKTANNTAKVVEKLDEIRKAGGKVFAAMGS